MKPVTRARSRGWRTALIMVVGGFLVLAGFAYDVVFAGIPYQDPTPDLVSAYNFHQRIAYALEIVGIVVICSVFLVTKLWRAKSKATQGSGPRSGAA